MRIHSVFESISGEAGPTIVQGSWCTFVRLQGCNLSCSWCDTKFSQKIPEHALDMSTLAIVNKIKTSRVLITGGEPLLQEEDFYSFLEYLMLCKKTVQVETNGSYKIRDYPCGSALGYVMDYKLPSSGMMNKMLPTGDLIEFLDNTIHPVWLKFVVADCPDVYEAIKVMREINEGEPDIPFIISPVNANAQRGDIISVLKTIAPELLENIIVSIQLHKILNVL